MELLFYTSANSAARKRLLRIIKSLLPETGGEICQTQKALMARLRHHKEGLKTLILLIEDRKELSKFVSMRDFFLDMCVILVLPDRKRQTASLGHKLRPRFIAYSDSNFSDVAAVLKNVHKPVDIKGQNLEHANLKAYDLKVESS